MSMHISKVIETVAVLQERLHDIDGLSEEHCLTVTTNGDCWDVSMFGVVLVDSEDFDETEVLEDQIVCELQTLRDYLTRILSTDRD